MWFDKDYVPSPGDIIFFDWEEVYGQNGLPNHVGIVEKVENGIVHTIEGNSDDMCRRRQYAVGYYEIFGYGKAGAPGSPGSIPNVILFSQPLHRAFLC